MENKSSGSISTLKIGGAVEKMRITKNMKDKIYKSVSTVSTKPWYQ